MFYEVVNLTHQFFLKTKIKSVTFFGWSITHKLKDRSTLHGPPHPSQGAVKRPRQQSHPWHSTVTNRHIYIQIKNISPDDGCINAGNRASVTPHFNVLHIYGETNLKKYTGFMPLPVNTTDRQKTGVCRWSGATQILPCRDQQFISAQ
jgi:hypothetical protein